MGPLPLTAARARNAGFEYLRSALPHLEFVQFVDGDCELVPGWSEMAERFLQRARRHRSCLRSKARTLSRKIRSIIGCVIRSGIRLSAAPMPAAETPCFESEHSKTWADLIQLLLPAKSRNSAYDYESVAGKSGASTSEMTVHDAAMTSFNQWWKRTARGGHAYAEISALHASSAARIWQWEKMRAMLWGAVLPIIVVAGAMVSKLALIGALLYPAQICRTAVRRGANKLSSWRFSTFMLIAKFAEMQGIARYWQSQISGRRPRRVDYKEFERRQLSERASKLCPKSPS